ncbi:hypothetical protein LP417_23170 [Polaromonas sp. P1-6]|nr:hypothetical protein LP417_23170 [Polaromonas sp. P1-6]
MQHLEQAGGPLDKAAHHAVAVMRLVPGRGPGITPGIHGNASIVETCASPSMNSTARRVKASASIPTSAAFSPAALPLAGAPRCPERSRPCETAQTQSETR